MGGEDFRRGGNHLGDFDGLREGDVDGDCFGFGLVSFAPKEERGLELQDGGDGGLEKGDVLLSVGGANGDGFSLKPDSFANGKSEFDFSFGPGRVGGDIGFADSAVATGEDLFDLERFLAFDTERDFGGDHVLPGLARRGDDHLLNDQSRVE